MNINERASKLLAKYRDPEFNGVRAKRDLCMSGLLDDFQEFLELMCAVAAMGTDAHVDVASCGWQAFPDDPEEAGYLIGGFYMDGYLFHLHAFRAHITDDGEVRGHPALSEARAAHLEEFWATDPECRLTAIEIPGFEGEYFVYASPRDR